MSRHDNGGPGSTPTRRDEQTAPGSTSVPECDSGRPQVAQARDDRHVAALVAASGRRREELEAHLRAQLLEARAAGDKLAATRLCRRLDVAFVARAHRRAVDPELIRLRRQLRATA